MSNDIPRAPSNPEPLPSELLGIEHQLLADGASWERRVPSSDSFTRRIRSVLQEESMRDPQIPAATLTRETRARDAGAASHRGPLAPHRLRALVATVAAVVIVALLGAVFAALAHSHTQPTVGNGPHQQPQTPAPIATQVHTQLGMLTKQPSVTNQPGTPIIAPSDPKVMYEYAYNSTPVLRRSDDGGKTWHNLAFPYSTVNLGALYLAVSPIDAQSVFLEMDVNIPAAGICQEHADYRSANIPTSGGGIICPQTFHSEDGGNIWRSVFFPVSGSIFGNGVVFYYNSTAVQAQGNRLYVRVYDKLTAANPTLDIRILSTTDNGASWHVADTSLTKLAPHVCAYAATPTGSTLFAISMAGCTSAGSGTLWRSDDAGATWTRVGTAPNWAVPIGPAMVAANASGDPNQPLLYAVPSGTVTVSSDGGKSWQPAPTAGLPKGASLVMMGSAALPDGTIIAAFSGAPASSGQQSSTQPTATPSMYGASGVVGCYYWSPGASAWQPLTPGITMSPSDLENVFVSSASASAGPVVTFSIGDISSTNPLYTIQPFA